MKKITKLCLMFVMLFAVALTLVGCGSVSESYAKKINEAAKAEEYITKDEVFKALGDPAVDLTISGTGYASWYKGYETFEDAMAAFEEGKTVVSIRVTFLAGNATAAVYSDGEPSNK